MQLSKAFIRRNDEVAILITFARLKAQIIGSLDDDAASYRDSLVNLLSSK